MCAPPWEVRTRRVCWTGSASSASTSGASVTPSGARFSWTSVTPRSRPSSTWLNNRHVVVLKARQVGFSTLIATYAFWLTFFYPDRAVVLISKTERESAKLLQKAKYGYRFLPEWMKIAWPDARREHPGQADLVQRVRHRVTALRHPTPDEARASSSSSSTRSATCPTPKRRTQRSSRSPTSVGGSSCSAPPTGKATCCTRCGTAPRPAPTVSSASSSRGRPVTATKPGTTPRRPNCRRGRWPRNTPTTPTKRSCVRATPSSTWMLSGPSVPTEPRARGYVWQPS